MSTHGTSYRPDIDGLRGLAVFIVVAFHAGLPMLSGGFVGVDIFFVISGYLICAIIQREIWGDNFTYAAFYVRRAKRILPALYVVILVSYLTGILMLTSTELIDLGRSAMATIGAASNVYFWKSTNYFAAASELKPLMMTWSLGVEEQFYIFFPVILMTIKRTKLPLMGSVLALAVLSLAASVVMTSKYPTSAFFLLPSRAWELGAGALLAIYESRSAAKRLPLHWQNVVGPAGLFLVIWSICTYDDGTHFPGLAATVPVFGTVMMILSRDSMLNQKVLSHRTLVFTGLISYSWYLWHWPVFSFARLASDHQLPLTTTLPLAVLSFILAILSWRFVERPFRSPNSGSQSKTLLRYGIATIAVFGVAGTFVAGSGWPTRFNAELAAVERSGANVPDPCLATYRSTKPNLSSDCFTQTGKPVIALLGDSHAAALAPAVRLLAKEKRLDFLQMTKSSCATLIQTSHFMPNHPNHDQECASFNEKSLQQVLSNPDIRYVILAGYWSSPLAAASEGNRYVRSDSSSLPTPEQSMRNFESGLRQTVTTLKARGKHVILVRDVPIFDFDPVRSIVNAQIPVRAAVARALGAESSGNGESTSLKHLKHGPPAEQIVNAIAKEDASIIFLDTHRNVCRNDRCLYHADQELLYIDSQHLSPAGARLALSSLRQFNYQNNSNSGLNTAKAQ